MLNREHPKTLISPSKFVLTPLHSVFDENPLTLEIPKGFLNA
jgi:hypothetical protein